MDDDFALLPLQPGVKVPALVPGTTQLWLLEFDTESRPPPSLLSHLNAIEQTKAARFRDPASSFRFSICRSWLKALLSIHTGLAPEKIHFTENTHGKPSLPGQEIQFNIAHSGRMAALAFNRIEPVGVDVEFIRKLHDIQSIIRRFYTPSENHILASFQNQALEAAFFTAWSCKEAVIKADGRGLALGTDKVEVLGAQGEPLRECEVISETGHKVVWTLHPFRPADDAFGCLATLPSTQHIQKLHVKEAHNGSDFAIS